MFGSDYETPDGTGVRDYIHITDLAVGHVSSLKLILQPDYTGFRAFNLGKIATFSQYRPPEIPAVFGDEI